MMAGARSRTGTRARRWLRLPRRTLRLQLAVLYAGFFLVCGVAVFLVPVFSVGTSAHVAAPSQAGSGSRAGRGAVQPAGVQGPGPSPQVQELRAVLVLAGLVGASLAVGWAIAGRLLRPLRTITSTARDISASNLNRRLALNGRGDEFAELADTLDDLFGRLEASFDSQRHFVANASHELRTPLTAERTLIQVALADPDATADTFRAMCQELLALSGQQERLIDALLTLASSERGVEQHESFDLADIAGRVLLERRREAERRSITFQANLPPAPAAGDASLAESLVANLADNAIRHNVDGGHVDLATSLTAGLASLRIANTGPLIPAGEVDRLFQPFQRLGAERLRHVNGHGLGLAIVRAIADVHGATLTARARPEGGLDIEIGFPRPG
jgi:signal transduction histidine kinase